MTSFMRASPWRSPCSESEMYLNEAYHWWACESILAFDMSHKEFRSMKLPDLGNLWDVKVVKSFAVLNSCIALFVHVEEGQRIGLT